MLVEFRHKYEMNGTFTIGNDVYLDLDNGNIFKAGFKIEKIHRNGDKVSYDLSVPAGDNKKVILKEVDSSIVCADPKDLI